MIRRHLKMTPEEWDALPWWQARMYWEGLEAEFMQHADDAEEQDAPEQDELSALSARGFHVRRVAV